MKVILASASARRQELLKNVVEEFEIEVSNFDEDEIEFRGNLSEYVKEIAKGKAMAVAKNHSNGLVIGSDTIVTIDGKILGKPKDEEDAVNMLKKLSGRVHHVYSGLVLIDIDNDKTYEEYVSTEVKFSHLSDREIKEYVQSKDPMDKAGAYGIQGKAGVFVEGINGDYYNVVGLPMNRLNDILKKNGYIK